MNPTKIHLGSFIVFNHVYYESPEGSFEIQVSKYEIRSSRFEIRVSKFKIQTNQSKAGSTFDYSPLLCYYYQEIFEYIYITNGSFAKMIIQEKSFMYQNEMKTKFGLHFEKYINNLIFFLMKQNSR